MTPDMKRLVDAVTNVEFLTDAEAEAIVRAVLTELREMKPPPASVTIVGNVINQDPNAFHICTPTPQSLRDQIDRILAEPATA